MGHQKFHAIDLSGPAGQVVSGCRCQLGLQACQLLFKLTALLNNLGKLGGELVAWCLKQCRCQGKRLVGLANLIEQPLARNGLKPPNACCNARLRNNLKKTNVARAADMGPTTEFTRASNVKHSHLVAVLLTKERHGPPRNSLIKTHDLSPGCGIF